jgi:hypothetical protein
LWHEATVARLPKNALARIKTVLQADESQMQFIAKTIMREVERRERAAGKRKARRKPSTAEQA